MCFAMQMLYEIIIICDFFLKNRFGVVVGQGIHICDLAVDLQFYVCCLERRGSKVQFNISIEIKVKNYDPLKLVSILKCAAAAASC